MCTLLPPSGEAWIFQLFSLNYVDKEKYFYKQTNKQKIPKWVDSATNLLSTPCFVVFKLKK